MTNKQCERRLAQALGALHPKTDVSAVAGAMPAPAAATPVSVPRIHRVRRYVAAVAAAAVMMAGVGTWWLTRPEDKPPVVPATDDGAVTTTVTTAPTEGEDTTTTTTVNTTAPEPTIDGGIVAPPTTAPAPSKPTATQAPTTGKTEPPKSTSGTKGSVTAYIPPLPTATQPTAGSDRLLITGDEPDNDFNDAGMFHKNEKYFSHALQEQMDRYKGVDATYAVLVAIPATHEDMYEDFWASTEELAQFYQEYYDVLDAFEKEALLYNPTWDRSDVNDIEIWTDTMRENWDYWVTLVEKRRELEGQPRTDYVKSVLSQRLEELIAICEKEPIVTVSETFGVFRYAYYAELTAEQINTLAVKGGYVFRLASGEPKNPIIDM